MAKVNPDEIKGYLVRLVEDSHKSPVAKAADQFKVTRITANRYLNELIQSGDIIVTGTGTQNRHYMLGRIETVEERWTVEPTVREEDVWRSFQMLAEDRQDNERLICSYGLTEMVNNAVDHSGGEDMSISFRKSFGFIEIVITDDGMGIFNKIAQALHLEHVQQALLELSKGKFTTDPEKHSGEGIFFTSRMFDEFSILSGNLLFSHIGEGQLSDWLVTLAVDELQGTEIRMKLYLPSRRIPEDVYDQYRVDEPGSGFTRTVIPLSLAEIGDEFLLSRSQARRVLARANRFKEVILNFSRVESIGQAFADEIFRVFANGHPDVNLITVACNAKVQRMIDHVRNAI